ncbi:hypothetical protein HUU59_11060 [bacterium]|nr:hypothetical protein [bacterium]
MPRQKSLTDKQLKALIFVGRYIADHGYSPTTREIGAAIGTSSTNGVTYIVEALKDQGLLTRTYHVGRTIRLTEDGLKTFHAAANQ